MVRLLLVAAQKTMVDSLVTAALGAKLEPMGLDLVPFAMVRAVGATGAGWTSRRAAARRSWTWARTSPTSSSIPPERRGSSGSSLRGRDITGDRRGLSVEDEVAERLKRGELVEESPPRPSRRTRSR